MEKLFVEKARSQQHVVNGSFPTGWTLTGLDCMTSVEQVRSKSIHSTLTADGIVKSQKRPSRAKRKDKMVRKWFSVTLLFRKELHTVILHFFYDIIESSFLVSRQEDTFCGVAETRSQKIEDEALGKRIRLPINAEQGLLC